VTAAPTAAFWGGRRVLLTGHTGFKGAWLALWLQHLGAEVHGLALGRPSAPALYDVAGVEAGMAATYEVDVRDRDAVAAATGQVAPEVVLHLAAQPLVRRSIVAPIETYATNVMGTAHVLEAVRATPSVRAVVVVTTDKCYENREWQWGYRETEPLGGKDPYSSSKAAAELVAGAYRATYFSEDGGARLATARAGNVIGGGDWGADRLVPDLLLGFASAEATPIRNPRAVRPWQHVLNPLEGYLVLAERLAEGSDVARPWNFGPAEDDARAVGWVADRLVELWGEPAAWRHDGGEHPPEAGLLKLDSSEARRVLGWAPRWDLGEALRRIVEWHAAFVRGDDMGAMCRAQLVAFASTPEC
jgi:CDP-glucose 4,6-dehydratase